MVGVKLALTIRYMGLFSWGGWRNLGVVWFGYMCVCMYVCMYVRGIEIDG